MKLSQLAGLGVLLLAATVSAAEPAFSWQKAQAKVVETGDLEWSPEPFIFEAGRNARYIDFAGGDDANPGTKERPWKHHPWDPAAAGEAKSAQGVDTWVFKGGVTYRGVLRPPAGVAGTAKEPLQLTSDPSWGSGEAVIAGSEIVANWQQGGHEKMPDAGKVWHADLSFLPRAVWMVAGDKVTRLKLARTPNWTESDPDDVLSEWWVWENPRWWTGEHKATVKGRKMHLGIDRKNLTREPDYYQGAIVWSEWGIMMGAPYPTAVEAFDEKQRGIVFQGPWFNDSQSIHRDNRYSLEDKPHYLDEAGEFWFEKKGNGGRLYVRLPNDADPKTVTIEAARHTSLIDSKGMSHVRISGLSFRFGNIHWDLTAQIWQHPDVGSAAIRILGPGQNVVIRNCRFEHLSQAIRMQAEGRADRMDGIVVSDNDIAHIDHGAIEVRNGGGKEPPIGTLGKVSVLRNRLEQIGARPIRPNGHHALTIAFPEVAEVAGNILHRCYASGLFLHGGKGSGSLVDVPLSRWTVHHNKVTDSLLASNDWGGIETWQGGPFYVFNNVSGNPGGLMHWTWAGKRQKKEGTPRFGFAYYLDGSFKNYLFNNIAWGKNNELGSQYANCAAFQEIISYQNSFFNNTAYKFVMGSRRQAPQAGRNQFIGNVFQDISQMVFRHSDAEGKDPNARDAGKAVEEFAYETNAYSNNILHAIGKFVGVFEARGGDHATLEAFRKAMADRKAMASDVGVMAEKSPLRDPAKGDYRLAPGSAAVDKGAKVFVPWGLYATVGEWNFTRNNADPAVVIDDHWYLTPYHVGRDDYYKRPMYPLKGVNIKADDYVAGPLEDWTAGALKLNGTDQYLVLSHAEMSKPFGTEGKAAAPKADGAWVSATVPVQAAVGQKFAVQLKPAASAKGQKICAHLHWLKAQGFGGFNAWGGMAQEVKGEGPYTFTFTPEDKPGLDKFVLTVFLSPDGSFEKKTASATVPIEKSATAGELKMHTVALGGTGGTEAKAEQQQVAGADLRNPEIQAGNFLVEVYFRTEPGRSGGGLVSKMSLRGYELSLDDGKPRFRLAGQGGAEEVVSDVRVNDGAWHHVLVEVDRARRMTMHVDGKVASAVPLNGVSGRESISNEADLLVGKSSSGSCFAGTIEFVRIARGTLADARTSIEELYAWQFDGPFLRDFAGRKPVGRRDAGAIELTPEK